MPLFTAGLVELLRVDVVGSAKVAQRTIVGPAQPAAINRDSEEKERRKKLVAEDIVD